MIRLESDHLPTINPSTLTAGANTMTKASHFPNLQTDLETIPLQRARLQFVGVADWKYNIILKVLCRRRMKLLLRIHLNPSGGQRQDAVGTRPWWKERLLSRANKLWFRCGRLVANSSGFSTVNRDHLHCQYCALLKAAQD